MAVSELTLDRSTRMGVDMPFKFGVAQMRLTGGGDARMDFAYDATMRPLSFFASTGLLKNALIANALIRLPGHSRLMVYGITTTGAETTSSPDGARRAASTASRAPCSAATAGRQRS